MVYEKRPTYAEMLRDPRWQRKRLEILERDRFTCVNCGDSERELHVHHGYYERGKAPWEYDAAALITLCADCHERAGDLALRLNRMATCLDFDQTRFLTGVAWAMAWLAWQSRDDRWQISEDEWRTEIETPSLNENFVYGAELVFEDAQRVHDEHMRQIDIARRKRELLEPANVQLHDCRP